MADLSQLVQQLASVLDQPMSLVEFDSKSPLELLQLLNDVLGKIDAEHERDIRDEAAETTAQRLVPFLRVLGYRPPGGATPETLMNGLQQGDRGTIYPILGFVLGSIEKLKVRAYLARFLISVPVPDEFSNEPVIQEALKLLKDLQIDFKKQHQALQKSKQSGLNLGQLRQDISAMEAEKEQLMTQIAKVKRKVENEDNYAAKVKACESLQAAIDEQALLAERLREQNTHLQQSTQHHRRLNQRYSSLKLELGRGGGARGLMAHAERQVAENRVLLATQRPMELQQQQALNAALERIAGAVTLPDELERLRTSLSDVRAEVRAMEQAREAELAPTAAAPAQKSNGGDGNLAMFRQQAAMVARRKDAVHSRLQAVRDELEDVQQQRAVVAEEHSHVAKFKILKGAEFQEYLQQVRAKTVRWKQARSQLQAVTAEVGVLSRTLDLLMSKAGNISEWMEEQERKKGVHGYTAAQSKLEDVSRQKSSEESAKEQKLAEIARLVTYVNEKIAAKQEVLKPLVRELKQLRAESQEMADEYDAKKTVFENSEAGLASEKNKLDREIAVYREECVREESRFHFLTTQFELLQAKESIYQDPGLKKRLATALATEEKRSKVLRSERKHVKEAYTGNKHQMELFRDVERLLQIKLSVMDATSSARAGPGGPMDAADVAAMTAGAGGIGVDRLVL